MSNSKPAAALITKRLKIN